MNKVLLTTLTGILLCGHCGAPVVPHADSHNRDIVGASRLEVIQQERVVYGLKGTVNAGHTEVVLLMVHVLWRGPGEADGVHSLRLHPDGAGGVGN